MMQRFKNIKCKECETDCKSGKRGLCDSCYANSLIKKAKESPKPPKPKSTYKDMKQLEWSKKAKEKAKKDKASRAKQISMDNLQKLHQYLIRLLTGDTCASCNKQFSTTNKSSMKQGGHLFPKGRYKSTALLVPNIYQQCAACNSPFGGDGMPIDLYNYGVNYWGKDVMKLIHDITKVSYSFNKYERTEIFEYIIKQISKAEKLTQTFNKKLLLQEIWEWQQNQTWFHALLDAINKKNF